MDFDIDRLREETPGVVRRIHLNNAGAGLMPAPVVAGVTWYLTREAEIGGYEAAAESAGRIGGVYDSIARLIGAERNEIALTGSATAAWQMAFYALTFRPGDRILTGRAEYAANFVAFLQAKKRHGIEIAVVPDDEHGATDPAALEAMIDDRTRLIALTWVPTNGGLVNPAAAIGRIARRHAIPYLLDACQAVGQMPVNVNTLNCDMLSATGRKFLRGPRGTGFLYVRQGLLQTLEPAMIDHFAAPWVSPDSYELRGDARRFETWEASHALRLGLGIAADYASAIGLDVIRVESGRLATRLRNGLAAIPGVHVHDLGRERAAIVTFTVDGHEARAVQDYLGDRRINVSVAPPASTLLDTLARGLGPVVRASPHYYNTEDEIDYTLRAVKALATG